ncbi:hypothetical protein [Vibrio tubiashii]|uniref:hypothetical protein n=1 Tax=Vibrio tubiashii TaxID=29498 RepID=UPI00349E8E89
MYLAYQVKVQSDEWGKSRIENELRLREETISRSLTLLASLLSTPLDNDARPLKTYFGYVVDNEMHFKLVEDAFKGGVKPAPELMATWVNITAALSYMEGIDKRRYDEQKVYTEAYVGSSFVRILDKLMASAFKGKLKGHFA